MAVTNNSNKPLIKYEGIEISPGHTSNIGITRTFYSQLSSPYGDCRNDVETSSDSDSDYYKYTVLRGRYTRNYCYEICFQYKYAIGICNCSDPSVNSNVNNARTCGLQDSTCLSDQRKEFSTSNCDTDCPETCEKVDYSLKLSISSYPSKYDLEFTKNLFNHQIN